MADISKKLNITLDTINQKLYRVRNLMPVIGDSVDITINITEGSEAKNITDCFCRLLGKKSDGNFFEEKENIEIVDSENGIVKIRLSPFSIDTEGSTIFCLLIEDSDELVHVQKFALEVQSSMSGDIIESEKDNISSLIELNKLLVNYEENISKVNQKVQETKEETINYLREVDENTNIIVEDINEKLKNINDEIDYKLIKNIELKKELTPDGNYYQMVTSPLDITAEEMLYRSYEVFVGGKLQEGTYNTCIGKLTFYKQNDRIYPYFMSISNRAVNSRSLSISALFNGAVTDIAQGEKNFTIALRTNVSKDMINDNLICILTPLGRQ